MLRKTTKYPLERSACFDSQDDQYGAELAQLDRAILATVTYRDLFDYPVTLAEIHRYLHGIRCEQEQVRAALENDYFANNYLATDGEYYSLKHREALFGKRRRRKDNAGQLWPGAVAHGANLASLPFVRMVAVTGSLAVDNPGKDADIDFMLVTDGGRMWSSRAMAKLLQQLNSKFGGGELCVNHLLSTRALKLDDPGLYVAQELAQMVPLFGLDVYESLRDANRWVADYLPNANGVPALNTACEPAAPVLRKIGEIVLRSPVGSGFESWESRRKIYKYNETAMLLGRSTSFHREATGHRRNVRHLIESGFADRLKGPAEHRGNFRILFGQAYHLYLDPKLWQSMQPFPPLGSMYGAAVARSLGHDVRIHDSMLSVSNGEWLAALQVNDPDVVVLYEDNFNYLTKMCLLNMRDAALGMIEAAKKRGAKVLVCSSDSADAPGIYLQAGADFVLVGEGEDTFADVLSLLREDADLPRDAIPGLAFPGDDGELVQTGRRPVLRHLDELPAPAWDLIDLQRYRQIWTARHGRFALNMVTTRGCPYHCNWCAKPIWGQRYNARSPEDVVAELSWMRELTDFDYVWFMDDLFGLKPRWVERFADALDAVGTKIRFKCLSRPDLLLRKGEIKALAQAGCDVVWMGAESGSQKVLDLMEKGTTVATILRACELLRENGIRVGLFIQFGYPGEALQDIRATIRMIRQIMPDELGISVSYPLPGTPFHERVRTELGSTRHWTDSDDLAMLFNGPFTSRFYRALHRYVHSDMTARRAWRDLAGSGRQKSPGGRKRLRKAALLTYSLARVAWFATAMAVLSRMPHRSMRSLPPTLSPEDAALPTEQSGEQHRG